MNARPAIVYSVLRILAFLVPFGIMMIFPVMRDLYWLAAIFAALIGLSISMLFLRRPLDEVTSGLAARRDRARVSVSARDNADEDAAADAAAAADAQTTDAGPTDAEPTDAGPDDTETTDTDTTGAEPTGAADAADQPTNAQSRNAP